MNFTSKMKDFPFTWINHDENEWLQPILKLVRDASQSCMSKLSVKTREIMVFFYTKIDPTDSVMKKIAFTFYCIVLKLDLVSFYRKFPLVMILNESLSFNENFHVYFFFTFLQKWSIQKLIDFILTRSMSMDWVKKHIISYMNSLEKQWHLKWLIIQKQTLIGCWVNSDVNTWYTLERLKMNFESAQTMRHDGMSH